MKKVIALILSLLLIVAFALTVAGCKKAEAPKPAAPAAPAEAPAAPAAPAAPGSASGQISFYHFQGWVSPPLKMIAFLVIK